MKNNTLAEYLNHNKTSSFRDILFNFIDKKNMSDAEVYNKVNIDRRLFSKIRCNEEYKLNKYNIIKLCLSLSLNKQESLYLLNSGGYTLSSNNNMDLILSYCLENNIYDLQTVNNYLYTFTNTVI